MKNIANFLSTEATCKDALYKYIQYLEDLYLKNKNMKLKEKIIATKYYVNSIFNKSLIAKRRNDFNELYDYLEKNLPDLDFTLSGNKKPIKSFFEKVDMLQDKERSVDSAYADIHRYRLTINNFKNDTEESIHLAEATTLCIITFFLDKDYTLCEANPLKDIIDITNVSEVQKFKKQYPNVFLLDKKASKIPELFAKKIKNYMIEPKKSSYQGIHISFLDPEGNKFEVQIRTFAMHICAEYGPGSHYNFKNATRKINVWDYSKICVARFQYMEIAIENNKIPVIDAKNNIIELPEIEDETGIIKIPIIYDKAGIVIPIVTFLREKSF